MAIQGPAPKHEDDRVRRNAPIYDKIQVEWDGQIRGPELPKRWAACQCMSSPSGPHPPPPDLIPPKKPVLKDCGHAVEVKWHPATLDWYNMWRQTPQSMVFVATDWEFFAETAKLHDMFWSEDLKPSELVALAGALKGREEAYGGTFEARRKLRLEITSPQHKAAKEAQFKVETKAAVDYAAKLTQEAAKQRKGAS